MKKIIILLLFLSMGIFGQQKINRNRIADPNWSPPNGGLILDGSTQFASIPDNANLDFGDGDFSIRAIVNISSTEIGYILYKGTTTINYILYSSGGILYANIDDGVNSATASVSVSLDTLYDIIIVYDRSGNLELYLNGSSVDSQDITSVGDIDNSSDFNIGARVLTLDRYFNGYIWDVDVVNHALTQAEIIKAWNNGQPWLAETEFKYQGASQTSLDRKSVV